MEREGERGSVGIDANVDDMNYTSNASTFGKEWPHLPSSSASVLSKDQALEILEISPTPNNNNNNNNNDDDNNKTDERGRSSFCSARLCVCGGCVSLFARFFSSDIDPSRFRLKNN